MREIKFRAWDKINKEVVNMKELLSPIAIEDLSYLDYILQKDKIADAYTLMQFTGLLDKNGKEIWEGDIVKYSGYYFGDNWVKEQIEPVVWDEKEASYPYCLVMTGYQDGPVWCEVIGNIYENPDLIGG